MRANSSSEINHVAERQGALIRANIDLLLQGITLLDEISDSAYRDPVPVLMMQRVGPQLRHVLEFYQCFLDGLESGHVDYDARKRDELVEASRTVAITKMYCLVARLRSLSVLKGDGVILTAMEDCPGDFPDRFLTSSVERELQVLCSHTIHHYALIAFILAAHGVKVAKNFGVAPSTLRYRNQEIAPVISEAA